MIFDQSTVDAFRDVVGWKDHYDTSVIPALPATLANSESSLYVQDGMNRLVTLPNIQALLPSDYSLQDYLMEVREGAIKDVLTKVAVHNALENTGKDLVSSSIISATRLPYDTVTNESRFVGVRFALGNSTGIRLVINRIGLYLSAAQPSLTLYLFNSNQPTAINTYVFSSNVANSFKWLEEQIVLDLDDGGDNSGATWYLGYYQSDLVGNAVRYRPLNWVNGYACGGGCGNKYKTVESNYKAISKHVDMCAFYIAASNLPLNPTDRFDLDDVVNVYDNNFGFNFNITVKCHLGQFWKDNRLQFAIAIQKMCIQKVLEDFLGSNQSSGAEQNIQANAYQALYPQTGTTQRPYSEQVKSAIKSVRLNMGNVSNNPCLPCARKGSRMKAF